jgi:CheY-like chemotaxis protein/predicted regulator of Ras-like GTPase activity (Roadblock/LC7/MglB family)
LIVDPNQAFATMLQQSLEEIGTYRATTVHSGQTALETAAAQEFDLAIVDMGLSDVEPASLVRQLRDEHPGLALMVIPLDGEETPEELADLDLQGILPKPFFLPTLPERIAAALAWQAGEARAQPAQAPSQPRVAPVRVRPEIARHIASLLQEIGAQAVILTRGLDIVVQVSRLPTDELLALAGVIHESWHASARVAEILGKEQLRFEQSIEGDEHLLYSLALSHEMILSVVVEGHVALGMIRHRTKETAEAIRKLL